MNLKTEVAFNIVAIAAAVLFVSGGEPSIKRYGNSTSM
jgi:hypothetical protein